MAVAVGNTSSTGGNLSSGASWSHTIGAGSDIVLIVSFSSSNSTFLTGVTFGTDDLAVVTNANADQNGRATELWYVEGVTGTEDITITHSGGMHHSSAGAVDFNGATTPSDGAGQGVSGTTSSHVITAAGDDDYLVDGISSSEDAIIAADQASYYDQVSAGNHGNGSTQDGSVAGDTIGWTFDSSSGGSHVACRIPAAAATGGVIRSMAASGGLAGLGGLAGQGGGLAG